METKDLELGELSTSTTEHHVLLPLSTTVSDINGDDNTDDYIDSPTFSLMSSPLDTSSLFDFNYRKSIDLVVCSPDGTHIATLSPNGIVSLWDFVVPVSSQDMAESRKPKHSFKTEFKANNPQFYD